MDLISVLPLKCSGKFLKLHLNKGQSRWSYSMQNLRLMKDIDSQWTYWWAEDRTDKLGQAFVVSSQQEWQLHYPEVGRCPQHAAGAGGGGGREWGRVSRCSPCGQRPPHPQQPPAAPQLGTLPMTHTYGLPTWTLNLPHSAELHKESAPKERHVLLESWSICRLRSCSSWFGVVVDDDISGEAQRALGATGTYFKHLQCLFVCWE